MRFKTTATFLATFSRRFSLLFATFTFFFSCALQDNCNFPRHLLTSLFIAFRHLHFLFLLCASRQLQLSSPPSHVAFHCFSPPSLSFSPVRFKTTATFLATFSRRFSLLFATFTF